MDDTPASGSRRGLITLFLVAVLLGLAFVVWLSTGARGLNLGDDEPALSELTNGTPGSGPGPNPGSRPFKVGIVAGHWQSDSGAVCPDGLTEVSINYDVAIRTAAILQAEGYDAEVMAEFAPGLNGYVADAFVSIHADSCDVPGVSGFKVARVVGSAIPQEEDRFVDCMVREYGRTTGLAFHEHTITFDMTQYHAFTEIDPLTPGVIIELGFMGADRWVLTENSYELARGIARGIACFLEGD